MILSNNPQIKEALVGRWKQLGIYSEDGGRALYKEVVRDATERAPEMKITSDRVSKYLSGYKWGGKHAGLTDNQITWLMIRYGIKFRILLGDLHVSIDGKEFSIQDKDIVGKFPSYNETQCLKDLENLKFLYLK